MLVTIISSVTNVALLYLMYKGIYIPNWKIPLIINLIFGLIYLFARFGMAEQKVSNVSKIFTLSTTTYFAYSLSSLVYYHWKMERIISAYSMMKISLIILLLIVSYLNFVYIRAEISYKRKRGNIRIQKEKPKTLAERWKEWREGEDENEIIIQLGNSTESDERTPPI